MGVAIASGVPVVLGLFTGVIAGIVVGSLAGCPLQVSGPAAGLAVIVYDIVQRFGVEQLGLIVLIAGIAQTIAGSFRLGQWFRAVSPAVIKGMLAGIGVLIFASQFHVMLDSKPTGNAITDIATMPASIQKAFTERGFAKRDQREFRLEHLRIVGKLRREQAEIHHAVVDLLPVLDISEADQAAVALKERLEEKPEKLKSLVSQQQEIAATLADINVIVRGFETETNDKRSQAIIEALTATDEKMGDVVADLNEKNLLESVESQAGVLEAFDVYLASLKNHGLAAQLGLLTIAIIVLWPLLVFKRLKIVPAPLVAIVVVTAVAYFLSLPLVYVDVPTSLLVEIQMPDFGSLWSESFSGLVQAGLVLAAVGSAETLLCATATDQLHTGPRTKYNKELFAQGIGNVCCGMVGALPMTGVIVRSNANINAGGTTRLSAILHGFWLLLFIAVMTPILRLIPTSALAAILVYTGYKLMNPQEVRELKEFGSGEVAIFSITVLTIVGLDLLTGIAAGFALATIKLLYRFSRLRVDLELPTREGLPAALTLSGSATFLGLPMLANGLEDIPEALPVKVEFHKLDYIDHACIDHLQRWAEQHEATGGAVHINWDSLSDKYNEPAPAERTAIGAEVD